MASLNVRGIDPATHAAINRAARARGITNASYLTALVTLHQRMQLMAQASRAVAAELEALHLHAETY